MALTRTRGSAHLLPRPLTRGRAIEHCRKSAGAPLSARQAAVAPLVRAGLTPGEAYRIVCTAAIIEAAEAER